MAYKYNKENGWSPICVKDFDPNDPGSNSFLMNEYPTGSIESNAVFISVNDIYKNLTVDIKSADAIVRVIAEEICISL